WTVTGNGSWRATGPANKRRLWLREPADVSLSQELTIDASTREIRFSIKGGMALVRLKRGDEIVRESRGVQSSSDKGDTEKLVAPRRSSGRPRAPRDYRKCGRRRVLPQRLRAALTSRDSKTTYFIERTTSMRSLRTVVTPFFFTLVGAGCAIAATDEASRSPD